VSVITGTKRIGRIMKGKEKMMRMKMGCEIKGEIRRDEKARGREETTASRWQ